ncbi:hypothetical protein ACIOBL_07185 [Paenibacillus taichungensis]|uniref:hypothetical protein n=1 Tax=Paenibacillus taichungensis TaxID=484184 RepID=UPI003827C72D
MNPGESIVEKNHRQFVNPNDYPTNLKSVFVSIAADDEDTEVMLESYTLDPVDLPPVIRLKSEEGFELTSVTAYENSADMNLKVSVEDPDSVSVSLSTDNQAYIDNSVLNGKARGTLIVKPHGLVAGQEHCSIQSRYHSGFFVLWNQDLVQS